MVEAINFSLLQLHIDDLQLSLHFDISDVKSAVAKVNSNLGTIQVR